MMPGTFDLISKGPQFSVNLKSVDRTSGIMRPPRGGRENVCSGPLTPLPEWPKNFTATVASAWAPLKTRRSVVQNVFCPADRALDGKSVQYCRGCEPAATTFRTVLFPLSPT